MQPALFWQERAMPEGKKTGPQDDLALVTRDTQQRASMAQLLLLARLKARNRRDLAVDSMDRAAHVMFVTCKNWFSAGRARDTEARVETEPGRAPALSSDDDNNKATDAYRNH